MTKGRVIWITGLSGAGKTTLALAVSEALRAEGHPVVMLDGDELRDLLGAASVTRANHGREGRLALALKYARLCRMIADQGCTVVIATISLFQEVHAWNREHLPGYFEVYLKVPETELRRRDPKGIYRRFDAGEICDVAGLDLPVDEPQSPDWTAEFVEGRSAAQQAQALIAVLQQAI
ncbi:adenylyl-sulfate kinase [Paludibacterium purpuratum]|uniref:Adenylylsulfate kinase n=1 Tax=Paludibacterium purpuratum TaxID=1144873 RepID=A0A4R7B1S7_9NEIS|nr:adenylyl-sulfate kinase [Paludibacterium purpuratum]TDR73533.1 adenylylsulfate kinase [Paludibacterium purpuratum]